MENSEIILLRKFIYNHCTDKELALAHQLIKKGVSNEVWIKLMDEAADENPAILLHQTHRDNLYSAIEQKITILPAGKYAFFKRQDWLSGLAAALLLLFIADFIMYFGNSDRSRAMLLTTLTEGHERDQVQTSDGSQIWINNHSSIKYPEKFESDQRLVELEGEAFFKVVKDTEFPFVITTQNIRVTVLGTSFNVKSYAEDEEIVITVATGKIQMEANGQRQSLMPGEQLHYDKKTGTFTTFRVEPEEAYSWKDGWLMFNSISLADIAKTLERWYGVKVIIKDEALKKIKVTLKRKDENLNNVLDIISFSAGIEYEVTDKVITIKSKK